MDRALRGEHHYLPFRHGKGQEHPNENFRGFCFFSAGSESIGL